MSTLKLTPEERIAHILECIGNLRAAGESMLESIQTLQRGNERQDREIAELRARLPQEPAPEAEDKLSIEYLAKPENYYLSKLTRKPAPSPPEREAEPVPVDEPLEMGTVETSSGPVRLVATSARAAERYWELLGGKPAPVEPAETPGAEIKHRIREALRLAFTAAVRGFGESYVDGLAHGLVDFLRHLEREQEPDPAARIAALEADLAEAVGLIQRDVSGGFDLKLEKEMRAFLSRRAANAGGQ